MIPFRMVGPLARYTGYAVGFRGLVSKLVQYPDLDMQLRATKGNIPPETEQYLLDLMEKNGNYDRLGVVVGFPDVAEQICSRYTVCYTMYEASDIPDDWKPHVARANEVWVPSRFCGEVFKKYNQRVRYVPWGVDSDVFRRGKRFNNGTEYVFGAVGRQGPRKGTDVLVKSFTEAFGGLAGVRLIIKSRDTAEMPRIDNPQIEVVDEDWGEDRLAQFMRDIDCLVEVSRGEGCGMPPLQAVFSGTPVLATNWSGLADYVDGEGVWGINIRGLVEVTKGMKAKRCRWAEPDGKHLSELMQWAVETRPVVTGSYERWSLDNMGKVFHDCLETSCGLAGRS